MYCQRFSEVSRKELLRGSWQLEEFHLTLGFVHVFTTLSISLTPGPYLEPFTCTLEGHPKVRLALGRQKQPRI